MSHENKLWIEGYVFVFSEEKYSYSRIQKHCEMHGIKISKCKISNIINQTDKNHQSLFLHEKKGLFTMENMEKKMYKPGYINVKKVSVRGL